NVNNTVAIPGVHYNDIYAVVTISPDFIRPYGIGVLPGKDALPIVPERYTYGIRYTAYENGRYGISAEDQAYADYVGELIRGGLEVTFASDGGADAQGRFVNICRFFKVGAPTSRMYLTRLERKAVKAAYKTRQWGRKFYNLAQSGLVGMAMDEAFKYNVTEAYRSLFKGLVEPIHRKDLLVLCAAKSFLQASEEAIKAHVPTVTHSVMVSGEVLGQPIKFYPCATYDSKEEAAEAYKALNIPATLVAKDVMLDMETSPAPALFTLVSLQCEVWEKLHLSFSQTRDIAISLYERGFISSPLTSCAKLLESLKPYINASYKSAKKYPFAPDAEISGNHGIIITGTKPITLSADEQQVYDIIRERFLTNLAGATTEQELVVEIEINGEPFYGTIPYNDAVKVPKTVEAKLTGKSQFSTKSVPPKAPNMGDLAAALTTMLLMLSKQFNPDMPFTLAYHDVSDSIDRLIANRFLLNVCGEPAITGEGNLLLETFDATFALSNLMAYQVEAERLYANRKQSIGGARLMQEFGKFIYDKTEQLITDSRLFPAKEDTHLCPICGRHSVVRYPRVAKCHICGFTMPLQFMGHKFTYKEIDNLLTHGYTSQIEFTNQRGHQFYDIVVRGKGKGLAFAPIAAKLY
ncbi:MAG: DNA topoisomerase, partial [Muribaculum sp.]|nr:DNA topoisomerase [Muribaculum sp.]